MSAFPSDFLIPLSQGMSACVDEQDHARLSAFKWHAHKSSTGAFYARRYMGLGPGRYTFMYMHREILGLLHGDGRKGDHKNSAETLDNRRSNLRIATSAENSRNCRGKRKDRPDIPKGVWFRKDRNRWSAQIKFGATKKHLGNFATMAAAAVAYRNAAIQHHGEFAGVTA